MKIFLNKKPIDAPYGGGNIMLKMFADYCHQHEHEVVYSLTKNVDCSFIFDSRENMSLEKFDLIRRKSGKIIQRVNDNDLHREMIGDKDLNIIKASFFADGQIYISDWIRQYFCSKIKENKYRIIYNSCDRRLFNCNHEFNVDKLAIITHHWSDNINKGFDIYRKLYDWIEANNRQDVSFSLIGKVPDGLKFSKNAKIMQRVSYNQLPSLIKNGNIYLSGSLYEAGGCHVVEGMGCGLYPIVHSLGGGTVNYVDGYGENFKDIQNLIEKIKYYLDNKHVLKCKIENIRQNYKWSSDNMNMEYLNFAKSLLNEN